MFPSGYFNQKSSHEVADHDLFFATRERHLLYFLPGWYIIETCTKDIRLGVGRLNIELTQKQFRLLLDMVYIGNWVLNSARGEDRITAYDDIESRMFFEAMRAGMPELAEFRDGTIQASRAFVEGGIHEAIMDYEDAMFFDILAEELSRRDMQAEGLRAEEGEEMERRIAEYTAEFEQSGVDHVHVDL